MKLLLLAAIISTAAATATVDDVKVALLSLCVILIPAVGVLLKTAIQEQTGRLLSRRGGAPAEPTREQREFMEWLQSRRTDHGTTPEEETSTASPTP